MSGARELVITYGTFDSNDTGSGYAWYLTGVPSLSEDERTLSYAFDVVIRGTTAANVKTGVAAAITAWNERHQTFNVAMDGNNLLRFVDGTGTVLSGEEGAEFIQASWRLLGSHYTKTSRAYRVSVKVTRSADQTGKPGLLSQSIRVTTAPNGLRELRYSATFTPGPDSTETGTALERYEDATYGFDARVAAIQAVLTGVWELQSPSTISYDEDARTLRATAAYQELIFAQSATATNDAELVNARYDIRVERKAGFSIPGGAPARPLSSCTVTFSSAVVTTQTDLNSVIQSKVIPYVTQTVALRLGVASPILLQHGLKADPVNNRIAGTLLYLVNEGNVLEVSKRVMQDGNTGDSYIPVLDGKKWTRDKHTGPGTLSKRVVFAARVIGTLPGQVLDDLETTEIAEAESGGFQLVGWSVAGSPSVEAFPVGNGGQIITTVETRVLQFVYAEIRDSAGSGGRSGGLVTRARDANGGGAAGNGFARR